jgi:D-galactarolactone cycloisomerase
MRLERVRTYHLAVDLDRPFAFSQWRYASRHALFVEVVTDDGASGWGECYGPAAVTQAALTSFYGPLLVGRDPLQTDVLWHDLWRASLDFARRGVMMGAMSGLDMALWDLKGRFLAVSVAELMGGRRLERVPCYATGMYFTDQTDDELILALVAEAEGYVAQGFDALKIKVGKSPAFDAKLAREMRRALPEVALMADANHAYDLPEATGVASVLADEGYLWFEEPLSPEHPELYRRLHDAVPVPLAAGECEQTRWGFRTLLEPGGVDIAQPDLAYCGGPSEALKIRALASSLGLNVVPHAWGTMFNLAAATHFLASDYRQPGRAEPAPGRLECDRTSNPLRDELFTVGLTVRDGEVEVPSGPGLGVEVDVAALSRFLVRREEVS